jgi:dTDP-4-amino-4,6-dideoxygalactose transaminase
MMIVSMAGNDSLSAMLNHQAQMAAKAESQRVFGQARKPVKLLRVGLYARVSTLDQQILPMQIRVMREYSANRG